MTDRYAALRIRGFRLALFVRLFDGLAVQMMAVAVGWQIFELTHSPLKLGLIGLAEGLPYIAVALLAGQEADRREKKTVIIAGESAICLTGLGLLVLALRPRPQLWALYALIAWSGLCRSFQWTAMSAYLQMVVPKEIYPKAAAWNTSTWHFATIAGPAAGGLIYSRFGASAAYAVVAVLFLAALVSAAGLDRIYPSGPPAQPRVLDFLSGLDFVWSHQVILAAMSVDMFGVLFGGVEGVLPMFAARLGSGAAGLGFLRAAPAVGALLASLFLAHYQPFRRAGKAFLACVAMFGLCMIAFAISDAFWISLSVLAFSGIVDGTSMVIRASMYQALTPDSLRGRVASVNGIFIRSSNQLGAFESGIAAGLLGLVPSVLFGGSVTLVTVAVAAAVAPKLRKFEIA